MCNPSARNTLLRPRPQLESLHQATSWPRGWKPVSSRSVWVRGRCQASAGCIGPAPPSLCIRRRSSSAATSSPVTIAPSKKPGQEVEFSVPALHMGQEGEAGKDGSKGVGDQGHPGEAHRPGSQCICCQRSWLGVGADLHRRLILAGCNPPSLAQPGSIPSLPSNPHPHPCPAAWPAPTHPLPPGVNSRLIPGPSPTTPGSIPKASKPRPAQSHHPLQPSGPRLALQPWPWRPCAPLLPPPHAHARTRPPAHPPPDRSKQSPTALTAGSPPPSPDGTCTRENLPVDTTAGLEVGILQGSPRARRDVRGVRAASPLLGRPVDRDEVDVFRGDLRAVHELGPRVQHHLAHSLFALRTKRGQQKPVLKGWGTGSGVNRITRSPSHLAIVRPIAGCSRSNQGGSLGEWLDSPRS